MWYDFQFHLVSQPHICLEEMKDIEKADGRCLRFQDEEVQGTCLGMRDKEVKGYMPRNA